MLDAAVESIGGSQREGQRELAAAVASALAGGHHLVAEAPTGSGKSLAYLAPAVASGLKVVVATSTIALQAQLMTKDLPTIAAVSKQPFTFSLLKGRSNYLCRAKLRAAESPDALFESPVGRDFGTHLSELRAFAEKSETGDRADLARSLPAASWSAVSCAPAECPGRGECADGDSCFAELARERARGADVLVVNHALYCAHLAAGGYVLPEHDVVVLDEAHAFAENATNAFGDELREGTLDTLARMCRRAAVPGEAVERLQRAGAMLDVLLGERDGTVDLASDERLSGALHAASESVSAVTQHLNKLDDGYGKRTASIASGRLEALRNLGASSDDYVAWIERGGRAVVMRRAPIAPGDDLAEKLLSYRPVIAVSATMGGDPPFDKIARQIGFVPGVAARHWGEKDEEGRQTSEAGRGYAALRTPSSFDWRSQGLLYVARDLPAPGRDGWLEGAGERLCRLVNAAGGRALVLCTSNANVKLFAELLRDETDHHVLAQGDEEVGKLTSSFIEDEESVLVGTRSFWAGIDAPGVACVLVVIDRIPFPVPTDPLIAARRERAEKAGQNPFNEVDVPTAALVLAQGAGRLLRRDTDRGVVAVLDSRLALRDYRTQLLAAVPPLKRSVDIEEVCLFLEESTGDAKHAEPVEADDDPAAIYKNLTSEELARVRDEPCPVCRAPHGTRCKDADGFTMAFVHAGRFRPAPLPNTE